VPDDRTGAISVICGPTAAGKSSVALALASRYPIAIISADSRQIYRGFDIGTAKPTVDERRAVRHYGIDVIDPDRRYSAAAWAADAATWISDARSRGLQPVIVGGTGFYIRSLFEPLFEEPPLEEGGRLQLQAYLDSLETPELQRWCHAIDPARSHLGRAQLLRSIEVATLSGQRLSELHATRPRASSLTARYLLVEARADLARRISDRVDSMFNAGWIEEVKTLIQRVPENAPAWLGTGYDAVRRAALGQVAIDEARREVIVATRQYAKRQRTWFRNQLPATAVTTVDTSDPAASEIAAAWLAQARS
jgi:tRNA dimethylallyltransferase